MEYFFDTEEKIEALYKELEEWVGTPFKHRCRVKRKAVDCINLVGMVTLAVGVPVTFKYLPDYGPDWHLHNSKELLYEGIKKSAKTIDIFNLYDPTLRVLTKDTIIDGDVLLYKFGKASGHSAIHCRGFVYHSVAGVKVTKSLLEDRSWALRLTHVLRIIK